LESLKWLRKMNSIRKLRSRNNLKHMIIEILGFNLVRHRVEFFIIVSARRKMTVLRRDLERSRHTIIMTLKLREIQLSQSKE
jgi:hypothetical protein